MGAAQTRLNGAINDSVLSLTAGDALDFPASAPFQVEIGSERILVGAGAGTTAWSSLTRGYGGTTAASHIDGSTITLVENAYTSLALVKASQDVSTSTNDSVIQKYVDAANRRLINFIGGFIGPTGETSRTYDYPADPVDPRCFRIPTGIRSIGTMTVAPGTGQAAVTASAGDILLRPKPADRTSRDDPATEVWFSDNSTGDVTSFTAGYDVIVFTNSVFDWAACPSDLVEIATTLGRRLFKARQSASGDITGQNAWGTAMFSRFLSKDDIDLLRWWRAEIKQGY
jgi:hypothetical protein